MVLLNEGYESTFAVNHLGHFYLAERLLPMLRKANGRVVILSSGTHDPASISVAAT
jgi:NAD(P)-dependent dehydrogenase (short-subunit alcohol dehydrogenase family)